MNARETVLARLRAATPDLQPRPWPRERGPQPAPYADPVARFVERARALASTVARSTGYAGVPAAVAEYLRAQQLPRRAVVWGELLDLDWESAGIVVEARAADPDDAVGITGAVAGIAETGTLVLASGRATPATVSLLPETHIAVLPAARIVATLEDALSRLRAMGPLPRAVNLVSGPSRTADIEQTVTLGAHGPARVHIVLVG